MQLHVAHASARSRGCLGRPRRPPAAWALLFAAASAYWAAGGTTGAGTLAVALAERAEARDAAFLALLWVAAAAKALLVALALALRRPWRPRARRVVLVAGWITGGALALYGAAGLAHLGLMALGALAVPPDVGDAAVVWYVGLWKPVWLSGGVLFLIAARGAPPPRG